MLSSWVPVSFAAMSKPECGAQATEPSVAIWTALAAASSSKVSAMGALTSATASRVKLMSQITAALL